MNVVLFKNSGLENLERGCSQSQILIFAKRCNPHVKMAHGWHGGKAAIQVLRT